MDVQKLKAILGEYKKYFPEHWQAEKYKWEAVKCFQEHWDIDAPAFGEMFDQATKKTGNLLTSARSFPKGMILEFAKADEVTVREMFRVLFDESQDLYERIAYFKRTSDELKEKFDSQYQWAHHFQNINAISTYLWLMYPDRYYIYKYECIYDTLSELKCDFIPKRNGNIMNVINGFAMYDKICQVIQKDLEIQSMITDSLTEDCYPDPLMHTATIDVGYFISRYYLKQDASDDAECQYWWMASNPNIWQFANVKIGETMSYDLYNDKGHKRRIFQHMLDAKPGDKIIGYTATPIKKVTALAEIIRENDGKAFYFKKTSDLDVPISYDTLRACPELENMEYFIQPQGSLFKLTKEEYETILKKISEVNEPQAPSYPPYTREDFLSEVFMSDDSYDELRYLLKYKKNLILQGAPGTGKTFAAKRLAYSIMGEKNPEHVMTLQFHQSYSYEDFIMGYRPNETGFELKKGPFYTFCKKAEIDSDNPYFFIIDEMNRGNLSKIFGELFMLIEKDKRGKEHQIRLLYSDETFSVPENVYLIGMMNTADRSLAMVDYALRRRFAFYEMKPAFDSEGFQRYVEAAGNKRLERVLKVVEHLNTAISEDESLGSGFCIGHSYFCSDDLSDEWLNSVVHYEIIPLIREYWFDDPDRILIWENEFREALR